MIPVRVASRSDEAIDIICLELEAADGARLPPYTAGAHIDLVLGDGLIRQYSLCNSPAMADVYRIAVLRDPSSRGGSRLVHDALKPGATLHISGPRNLFELDLSAETYVLAAGGIGITPLLAMAHTLHALGKPFTLHYCTREASRAAFLDELREAAFAHRVQLHFDDDPTTALSLDVALNRPSPTRSLYVCGPNSFMDFVIQGAAERGWRREQIHREYFTGVTMTDEGDQPFDLILASTGQTLTVGVGQTAAEVLEAAGVFVPLSCEQGICGTCLTPVRAGRPDHRDLYQTDEERLSNVAFTPCCSRALTPSLTLDL